MIYPGGLYLLFIDLLTNLRKVLHHTTGYLNVISRANHMTPKTYPGVSVYSRKIGSPVTSSSQCDGRDPVYERILLQ